MAATYDQYSNLPNKNFFVPTEAPYDKDRRLYEMLTTECFNKFGVQMNYFILSFDTENDPIFKDDNNRRYKRQFEVQGYYELPRDEDLWSKFGIEGLDTFRIFMSKRHFSEASKVYDSNAEYTPKEGDIVQAKYNGIYYQIITCKDQVNQFLQYTHNWELTVERAVVSHFDVETSATSDDKMVSLSAFANSEDLFNIGNFLDSSTSAVLFDPPATETPPDSIWGVW